MISIFHSCTLMMSLPLKYNLYHHIFLHAVFRLFFFLTRQIIYPKVNDLHFSVQYMELGKCTPSLVYTGNLITSCHHHNHHHESCPFFTNSPQLTMIRINNSFTLYQCKSTPMRPFWFYFQGRIQQIHIDGSAPASIQSISRKAAKLWCSPG